jgi:hypothetical protein
MPYRRLPNTDKARLRALAGSYRKFESDEHSSLPYSEATLQKLREIYPGFRNALVNLEAARKQQSEKNKEFTEIFRKSKLYVQHYLQCMNFAIQRGEIKSIVRAYYDTEQFENAQPPINTEEQLVKWGKKVIDGDQQRIMKGGSPFYNPSIALVKINFEKFNEAYRFQKILEATTARNVKLVKELREAADTLILQLWNEIEAHFQHLPDNEKRSGCEAFGLVYVLRRKERKQLLAQKNPVVTEAPVGIAEEITDIIVSEQVTISPEPVIERIVSPVPKKPVVKRTKATEPNQEQEGSKNKVYQSELNFF